MNISNLLTVTGLSFDIIGAFLIYILPLEIEVYSKKEINDHLEFFKDNFDEDHSEKSKRYMLKRLIKQRFSKIGFAFLIIGSCFQYWDTLIIFLDDLV